MCVLMEIRDMRVLLLILALVIVGLVISVVYEIHQSDYDKFGKR